MKRDQLTFNIVCLFITLISLAVVIAIKVQR